MRNITPDDVFFARGVGRLFVAKLWDEAMHPRDDKGHFIPKDELTAAKTDTAKADELRAKTTDPVQRHRLDAIIADTPDVGTDAPTSGADAVRYPPSKATVVYGERGSSTSRETAVAAIKALLPNFGGADADFASIVGAPDGGTVRVSHVGHGYLSITVSHPEMENCRRTISKDGNGNTYMHNALFVLKMSAEEARRRGVTRTVDGASVLAKQVDYARKFGVAYIDTHAAGSKGDSMNGYYTWPALGYDAPLESSRLGGTLMGKVKAAFPGAKTVQDVFATKAGRDWWSENGTGINPAVFDLDPRSRSSITLAAYMAHKEAVAAAGKQGAPKPIEFERPGKDLVTLVPARDRRGTPLPPLPPPVRTLPSTVSSNRIAAHEADVRANMNDSSRYRTSVPETGRSAVNSLASGTPVGAAAYVAWAHHNLSNAASPAAEAYWQGRLAAHIEYFRGFSKNERAVGAEAFPQVVGILNRQRAAGNNPTAPADVTPAVTPTTPPPEVQRPTPERQRRNNRTIHGHAAGRVVRWMSERGWGRADVDHVLTQLGVTLSPATTGRMMGRGRSPAAPVTPEQATQLEELRATRRRR